MQGELVTTQSDDRVRLHGLYSAPVGPPKSRFDAVVLTHGLAGNFYSSRFLFYLAHTFLDLGCHVVIGNTRGHDDVNRTVRLGKSTYLGAAYEKVSECKFDLSAWCQFLTERGHSRIVLAGHSLGAIKSLYAQAHLPHPSVEGVVGLSATRLNHENLLESKGRDDFQAMLQMANDYVNQGRPDHLMQVTFPFPTMMAAQAYLDKYGNDNEYDWINFAHLISVPTHLLFGQLELRDNPAFEGLEEKFDWLRQQYGWMSTEVIPRADHFYSGCYAEAGDSIRSWLMAN